MLTLIFLLLTGPDTTACQKYVQGDQITIRGHKHLVLDNLTESWQLITRKPGTYEIKFRSYEDLRCFKQLVVSGRLTCGGKIRTVGIDPRQSRA